MLSRRLPLLSGGELAAGMRGSISTFPKLLLRACVCLQGIDSIFPDAISPEELSLH